MTKSELHDWRNDANATRADKQLMLGEYAYASEPLMEGGSLLRWFVVVEDEPAVACIHCGSPTCFEQRTTPPLRALGKSFSNQPAAKRAVERRVAALYAAPGHVRPFPHEGGCMGCFAEETCNACGGSLGAGVGRCTNGRCHRCHVEHCAPGGDSSPGHGYGPLGRAARP